MSKTVRTNRSRPISTLKVLCHCWLLCLLLLVSALGRLTEGELIGSESGYQYTVFQLDRYYDWTPVHNLEVEQTHTYFVGPDMLLVHNQGCMVTKYRVGSGKGGRELPVGSFSIVDWTGYPSTLPKPAGPFRLLEGAEYDAARTAANQANRAMHQADPALSGLQIHEIHPVKFDGSPTDPLNKIPLTPQQHQPATTWWLVLQRYIESR